MKNEIWMLVTDDIYELPLAIASNPQELADKAGVTKMAVLSGANRYRSGKLLHSRYNRISLEDNDNEGNNNRNT